MKTKRKDIFDASCLFDAPRKVVILSFGLLGAASGDELVKWDFQTGSASAGVSLAHPALFATSVTVTDPVYFTQDSDSGGWRTRGYSGSDDYVEFSITAGPVNELTLESLELEAFVRAANSSGGEWVDPELFLEYDIDPAFSNPVSAGVLDLGDSLPQGAGEGERYTSDENTFFATDLVVNPSETYFFRLRASNAAGDNIARNQLYYDVATDMTLSGTARTLASGIVWAGPEGGNWNTSEANFTDEGAPVFFSRNDDVVIETPGAIVLDSGGIVAGELGVTAPTGTTTLQGGDLSTDNLLKNGDSTLVIASPISVDTGFLTLEDGKISLPVGASLLADAIDLSGGILHFDGGSFTSSTGIGVLSGGGIEVSSGLSATIDDVLNITPTPGVPFQKSGEGTLTVTGTFGVRNSAPIDLGISAGEIVFSSSEDVNVSNETLIDGNIILDGASLMIHGTEVLGTGSVISRNDSSRVISRFDNGAAFVQVPVVLENDVIVEAPTGNSVLTFEVPLTGEGSVVKNGNGNVIFLEENTYQGSTTVNAGTLRLEGDGNPIGVGEVIMNGGTLSLENDDLTLPGVISGTGTILIDGSFSIFGGELQPVTLSGDNSYSGDIVVQDGLLKIEGTSSFVDSTRGVLTIEDSGGLGGNGSSEHEVVMQAGGALSVAISDWQGEAGTGYEDLYVHSFDAANVAMEVRIFHAFPQPDNFDESTRSFTFLTTSPGGLTNFNPANVSIIPRSSSTGMLGSWSIEQVGDSLVLTYTASDSPYDTWISGFGLSGTDAEAGNDYDLDGLANLLEFVLGGDPTVFDAGVAPETAVAETDVTFSFERSELSKGAASLKVQFGSDLENWTDVAIPELAGSSTVAGAMVEVVDGDPATLPDSISVTVPQSLALGDKLFLRLSAEQIE